MHGNTITRAVSEITLTNTIGPGRKAYKDKKNPEVSVSEIKNIHSQGSGTSGSKTYEAAVNLIAKYNPFDKTICYQVRT